MRFLGRFRQITAAPYPIASSESCGFREFNERYLTYPPPGTQPTNVVNRTCLGILFLALLAEVDVNPCASVYDIVS